MSEFYVGQRVVISKIRSFGPGTVVRIAGSVIGVRFDSPNELFHNLSGACEDHHGLWLSEEDLEPLENRVPEYVLGSAEVLYG